MNPDYFLKRYLSERPLFLSLIRAQEAQLFQKFLPLKKPILDVGCGDGFFAKVAFSPKKQVPNSKSQINKENIIDIGLDLERSRIGEARNRGIYNKIVIYDGRKIPFTKDSFNTVISNCVLEHIPDLALTLTEIMRVLRPKGKFITTVMAKPWEENLFCSRFLGDGYKTWMRRKQEHRNLFSKIQWDRIFTDTGFKIKESIGYLSSQACRLIDIGHYLSLPNLITYKLFSQWVMFPGLMKFFPQKCLGKIISKRVKADKSGAIFYNLEKPV